jgi:hypothetical protein
MSNADTLIRLLKPLAEQATPGPWYNWTDRSGAVEFGPSVNYTIARLYHTPGEDKCDKNTAYLTAASPANILSLIACIEQLTSELAKEEDCSRNYERKFHEIAAECADLASADVGTVGALLETKCNCAPFRGLWRPHQRECPQYEGAPKNPPRAK